MYFRNGVLKNLFFDEKIYEKFIKIVDDLKKLPNEQQLEEFKISQISKRLKFPEDILLIIIYGKCEYNKEQLSIKKLIKNIYYHTRREMATQKTDDILFPFLSKTKTYRLSNYLIADEFGYSCNFIYHLKPLYPEIYQRLEKNNKNSKKILTDLMEDFINLIKEAPVNAFNDKKNLLEYFLEKNFFYFHKIADLMFKFHKDFFYYKMAGLPSNANTKNFNDMINEFNKIYKQKTSKENNFFDTKTFSELFEEFIKYHKNDNSVNKAEIYGAITSSKIIFEEQNSELSIYAQKSDINKSNIYGAYYTDELPKLTFDEVIDSLNKIDSEKQNCKTIIKPNNTCNFSQKRKLNQEDEISKNNKKNKNKEKFYIDESNIDETYYIDELQELKVDEVIDSLNKIDSEKQNCKTIIKPNNTCNFSQKRKLNQEDEISKNNKKNKNKEKFYIDESNIVEAVFLLNEVISSQTQNNKLNIQQRIN